MLDIVHQGGTEIFQRQSAKLETHDYENIMLSDGWSVEEKNLRFILIDGGSWGPKESLVNELDLRGFLDARFAKKHCVIQKLLMGVRLIPIVHMKPLDIDLQGGCFKGSAEAFRRKDKEEGGKRVTLTDLTIRFDGGEGDPLTKMEENDEEIRFKIHLTQVGLKPKARSSFLL